MRGFRSATLAFGLVLALAAPASRAAAADAPPVPTNEWPDPNFFIQDTSLVIPAMNDALTGPIPPIRIEGYSTGAREVTVRVASTGGLEVGQYVAFAAPCDPALRATILQVQSIVPNTSFKATLEYPSGVPAASASCLATVVQHGDTTRGRVGGGDITSNVHRFSAGKGFPDFWISSRAAHTRLIGAGVHVLVVRKATDGAEFVYWNDTAPQTIAGTRRGFGVAVVVANGAGATARAYINNGYVVFGGTASAPTRTWIAVHATTPPSGAIFQEGVALTGPVGSTFVLGAFESVPYADDPPDHSFSTPRGQTVMSWASISPYVGARFTLPKTGSFDVNLGQASNLVISGGVTAMIGNLEGESDAFPAVLSVMSPAPALYGPAVHQVLNPAGHAGAPLYYAFASGNWPVRNNHLIMYGAPAAATWSYVSWDIQGFLLLAGP